MPADLVDFSLRRFKLYILESLDILYIYSVSIVSFSISRVSTVSLMLPTTLNLLRNHAKVYYKFTFRSFACRL